MAHTQSMTNLMMAGIHPIFLETDALDRLQHWLEHEGYGKQCFVLGDENTLDHCLPELHAHVPHLLEAENIQVRPGEQSKDLDVCRAIWGHLAERAAGRDAVLIALGGGVITDLGGFVAATYKRGISCILVPTTVMGMMDASIGGKTAIDLQGVKNLIGVYSDPVSVHIHPPFLRTLGKREVLSGVAEMIKHGLVRDADHWNAVRRAQLHDLSELAPLIRRSAAIKAEVVTEDPREQGQRKLLNFGHTIGHAMEAFALEGRDGSLLHGEAVAMGMVCATWLSCHLGLLDRDRMNAVQEHLLGLFPIIPLQATDNIRLLELMRNDKKNVNGGFRFTLLTGIGSAQVDVPVTAAEAAEAIENYRALIPDVEKRHHP